jgi:hypothetical protein
MGRVKPSTVGEDVIESSRPTKGSGIGSDMVALTIKGHRGQ